MKGALGKSVPRASGDKPEAIGTQANAVGCSPQARGKNSLITSPKVD